MFGLWAYDLNINFPHTSNLENLYWYHKLKSQIYYIYKHRWTFILLSCLRFYFFFLPIAFELYPLYHYKQTNNLTNKQNKTKQNKTKNKNKNKFPSFGVNTPNIVCKILFLCVQILQRIFFTFHTAVISPFVYINRFWRKHCEQK